MEDYNNKTKAELLEIIQNLEKKVEQLSSESVSGRKERFRDRYSNRILDNLPDMLTVLDRDANIVELVSSPSTNHVEGTTADSITQSNIKDILPEDAYTASLRTLAFPARQRISAMYVSGCFATLGNRTDQCRTTK